MGAERRCHCRTPRLSNDDQTTSLGKIGMLRLKTLRFSFVPCWAAILYLAILSGPALAGELSSDELYKQTTRSTAMIVVPQAGDKASQGSGWLVDRDRKLLVTNRHVVGSQKQVQVVFPIYRNGELIAERAY